MKKLSLFSLHKPHNSKKTIIGKFLRQFLFTIIIPTILVWFLYLVVLNIYFIKNTLSIQQTYLENSLSQLTLSFSNADNIFSSLESIPEISYYLDVYSTKREMLYSLKKSIRKQCDDLRNSNTAINSIRIYSNKPFLLYSDLFYPMDDIPLSEEETLLLTASQPTEILWYVTPSESGNSMVIPELYAYKKLYAYNYDHVIGYMELKLNPQILSEYFSQFRDNTSFHGGLSALYHNREILYTTDNIDDFSFLETIPELPSNTSLSDVLHNRYVNSVTIPALDLTIIITGTLTSLATQPNNMLMILITLFICLLLVLMFHFFSNINDLSRQILDFSSYIRKSNPDDLTLYPETYEKYKQQYEELHHLIHSYNNLIKENSTLMSKVRKMELLSQDARYQALQAQIHPHFIYGNLENIRMLALQNRDKDVADMIFSLSALIRHSLSISSKAVTLEDEIEISAHYLKIQKYRFGERLTYSFQMDPALYKIPLPSFILQPILENAIIYGVSNTFDCCELKVSISCTEDSVHICVANSGKRIDEGRLQEVNRFLSSQEEPEAFKGNHNGLALYNIKERLRIFFHGKASIRMAVENEFTQTIITIERSDIHVPDSDC